MNLTVEEIEKEVEKLDKDSKAIKKDIYKAAWYMRGAVSIEQAYALSFEDREIINEIIQENLKITEETHLPFI